MEKLNNIEKNNESEVNRLWQRFGFEMKPPKPGSPAEERLRQKCEEYVNSVLFSQKVDGSDQRRRSLHDEICTIITGKGRNDLDSGVVEKITNFASVLVTGMKIGEAFEEYNKHKAA